MLRAERAEAVKRRADKNWWRQLGMWSAGCLAGQEGVERPVECEVFHKLAVLSWLEAFGLVWVDDAQ